jgi:outer membrane receptor protein involved in Fe transport
MKVSRTLFVSLAAVLSVASYGQVAPPQNPPASTTSSGTSDKEKAVQLPAFEVTGTKANQYSADEAASVARIATSIMDSPLTVNVITPALIEDLGTTAMIDDVTYFAGMSWGRGAGPGGIGDRMDFRGFESLGGRLVDNFSQYLQPSGAGPHTNVDPLLIDHAEMVMGPDAILAPTGSPGGSMNIATKSPLFTASTDISMQYGNYYAGGVGIDSTGPIPIGDGKHWAYRVIADYQEYRAYMPGSVKTDSAAVEFTYKFSDTAKVTFKYIGEASLPTGEASSVGDEGEEVSSPNSVGGAILPFSPQPGYTYDGWNGIPTWSHQYDRNNIVEAELTAALSSRINMRLAAQVMWDNYTADNAYPSAAPVETWNQVTGVETSVAPLNPAALAEVGNYNHCMAREIQVQNDYAGNFNVGGISFKPLLGWEYDQFEITEWAVHDPNMPKADILGQSDGASYTPYNPVHPPFSDYTTFSANLPENGWYLQGYGLIQAGMFNDRLILTGSYSRSWAEVNDYKFNGVNVPDVGHVGGTAAPTDATFGNTLIPAVPKVNPWHDEYMAGILYKVLPNVSAYSSFTTNASIAGQSPLWQAGKQYEYGIKAEFFNKRLTITADHFQISENNIAITNPLFNTGQSTIATLYEDETNHGEELNISGGITQNLTVILSYTNMRFRDAADRRVRNIPDNMSNLLLNYHFTEGPLKDASVFVGVQHNGTVAGENAPNLGFTSLGVPDQVGYYIAAWTAANAGGSYRWRNILFNLNVDNVLNQRFWWQPASRNSVCPFPGLAVRLAMTIHL